MGFQDASTGVGGGGRKLSLASVGFAGAGVRTDGGGSGGYKELVVLALPKDDGAKVMGTGLPDVGEAVRVRTPLPFRDFRWLLLVQCSRLIKWVEW